MGLRGKQSPGWPHDPCLLVLTALSGGGTYSLLTHREKQQWQDVHNHVAEDCDVSLAREKASCYLIKLCLGRTTWKETEGVLQPRAWENRGSCLKSLQGTECANNLVNWKQMPPHRASGETRALVDTSTLQPSRIVPRLLTHRNCGITNVPCFKLLSLQ